MLPRRLCARAKITVCGRFVFDFESAKTVFSIFEFLFIKVGVGLGAFPIVDSNVEIF